MAKFTPMAILLLCSLFLLGCIGGAGTSSTPTVGGGASATPIAAPAEYNVRVLLSATPLKEFEEASLNVYLIGGARQDAISVDLVKLGVGDKIELGSLSVGESGQVELSLQLVPNILATKEFGASFYSPETEFNFPTVALPGKIGVGASLEAMISSQESLHQTNLPGGAFLPVVDLLLFEGDTVTHLGKFSMGVDGKVVQGVAVSPELKIIVSEENGKQVFKVDDSPAQIPLN